MNNQEGQTRSISEEKQETETPTKKLRRFSKYLRGTISQT